MISTWVLVTPAGFYLDEDGAWTTDRGAARLFWTRTHALRVKAAVHRREGVDVRVDGPAATRRQAPLSSSQRFALDLAEQHGGLHCAGEHWLPAGQRGPRIAAVTVHSLVRRGELVVTDEAVRMHGKHRRRRWQEVAPRGAAPLAERQVAA